MKISEVILMLQPANVKCVKCKLVSCKKPRVFAHLSALRGGTAEILPMGFCPPAGGIMTSRPGEGLADRHGAGRAAGELILAGLRGRGL